MAALTRKRQLVRARAVCIGHGGGGVGEGIGLGAVGTVNQGQFFGMERTLGGSSVRRATGARTSATNVQVAGVDEADIVKTDGKYVYFAVNGAVRIASTDPPRIVSVTRLAGRAKELFLHGDRVVVYVARGGNDANRCTYGYDCDVRGDGSRTQAIVSVVVRASTATA